VAGVGGGEEQAEQLEKARVLRLADFSTVAG